MITAPPSVDEIVEAAACLSGLFRSTPLTKWPTGTCTWVKVEAREETGALKFRGALHNAYIQRVWMRRGLPDALDARNPQIEIASDTP